MCYLRIFIQIYLCRRYFLLVNEFNDTAFPCIGTVEERTENTIIVLFFRYFGLCGLLGQVLTGIGCRLFMSCQHDKRKEGQHDRSEEHTSELQSRQISRMP